MVKPITLAVALMLLSSTAFAQKKVTVADFAGTWNIELMSHQIALVIEPLDGNKVNATMMMMGRDMPLQGELVDNTLLLKGIKPEGGAAESPTNGPGVHAAPASEGAKPITVTLQDDGTIAGEMMTSQGAAKWTGERLKTKKKG
jgi:hypothetical protein